MQPSLEKLRKFFGLERERQYDNSAIIGGLAKMLDYWEAEARADGESEDVIQAVGQRLRSYGGLSPESRADVLKGLWKRIGETYPDAAQKQRNAADPASPTKSSEATPKPQTAVTETAPAKPAPQHNDTHHVDRTSGGPRPHSNQPSRAEAAPGGKHSQTPAALNAPLTVLQGVGPKHAATLESLGMRTLGDMLYYFPRRY